MKKGMKIGKLLLELHTGGGGVKKRGWHYQHPEREKQPAPPAPSAAPSAEITPDL